MTDSTVKDRVARYGRRAHLLAQMARSPGPHGILQFRRDRATASYRAAFSESEPLVSVCIATYNRGALLVDRAIASILRQTYANLEVIVVGDHCTDDTAERMSRVDDRRVRFVNLSKRGTYPDDPTQRWMVAGTTPMNHALGLARGSWITHLDDDDTHEPDRIQKLLAHAQANHLDLIWHPFLWELPDGSWRRNDAETFGWGKVTTSSVFYHHWLKRIAWDINAYKAGEPGDWHRLNRMRWVKPAMGRYDEALLHHFREGNPNLRAILANEGMISG